MSDPVDKQLCQSYSEFCTLKQIWQMTEKGRGRELNASFAEWRRNRRCQAERDKHVKFSPKMIKHLHNRWQLPQVGGEKKQMFTMFFAECLAQLNATNAAATAAADDDVDM